MPKTYFCPFWKWEESKNIHCEAGRLNFPDKKAKREYAVRYCACMNGWKTCSLAVSLQKYYESERGEKYEESGS